MSKQIKEKIIITSTLVFNCANEFQAECAYKMLAACVHSITENHQEKHKKNNGYYSLECSKPTKLFKYPF